MPWKKHTVDKGSSVNTDIFLETKTSRFSPTPPLLRNEHIQMMHGIDIFFFTYFVYVHDMETCTYTVYVQISTQHVPRAARVECTQWWSRFCEPWPLRAMITVLNKQLWSTVGQHSGCVSYYMHTCMYMISACSVNLLACRSTLIGDRWCCREIM